MPGPAEDIRTAGRAEEQLTRPTYYMSMPSRQQSTHERAEASFKRRELQEADASTAMKDYRAAEQAVRDKTKRLREERLVREASGPRPVRGSQPKRRPGTKR